MYRVYFKNFKTFTGGKPSNSKWNTIPDNKFISKIEYPIKNYKLILGNFESYNHIVEWTTNITQGKKQVTKIILMGKHNKKVYKTILDLKAKKVYKNISPTGKEYNNKPVTGWKNGIKNKKPYMNIDRIKRN